MFACAKSLFISDQDKRKHFCLLLRLFLGNRQEVGSFQSRMIKVISKPSQKRQSMKNADRESCLSATVLTCSSDQDVGSVPQDYSIYSSSSILCFLNLCKRQYCHENLILKTSTHFLINKIQIQHFVLDTTVLAVSPSFQSNAKLS